MTMSELASSYLSPAHAVRRLGGSEIAGREFDLRRRELRSRGAVVPLGGRAVDIVEALVRAEGELVTTDALMAQVWPNTIVEENRLQVHISAIRRALGPDRTLLQTASGRGYRLLGAWRIVSEKKPAVAAALPPGSQTNFPAATSELFGRSAAVRQIRDLLTTYRVVTLTGLGGIGKTSLALEVARGLLPSFQGKGWLVELAPLLDAGLVRSAAVAALGLTANGPDLTAETIARVLADDRLILVLDNCEHVIDGAARLAETVVRLCPQVRVLATSREALRIDGEFVYRVPPLDVPPAEPATPGDVLSHSAVQLFLARMRAHDADFVEDAENLSAIAAICRHLDGIPLAIEFAAARAAVLGIEAVAAGTEDRFALLTSGRRTALPRQQTLRATFDWSYDLLSEEERRLLRRLAIFPGGFTFEAAAAVASPDDAAATADAIAGLVGKSLLGREESGGQWRLLATTRAYALDKLSQSGERDETARRHTEFFRDRRAITKMPWRTERSSDHPPLEAVQPRHRGRTTPTDLGRRAS
jgi:predicted ATPase/DNA-binding winged helix-turn-helix (wHTH) protein